MIRNFARALIAGLFSLGHFAPANAEPTSPFVLKAGDGMRWRKGNTHTHTLWSDGDAAPELAVDWYKSRGYDFLSLSDHNILSKGERWFEIDGQEEQRLTSARLEELREKFGDGAVEVTEHEGRRFMRLKTLDELKAAFEVEDRFLLIQAEEITSPQAVHVNGLNLREFIPPADGSTVREILQKNFDAVERQSKRFGLPMLAHLNHPNWRTGVTAEDIMAVGGERFFEVYNGHGGVRNWGAAEMDMPSTDRLWDIILSMRLKEAPASRPLYGLGTDDTHQYFEQRVGLANAGRGWIWVLAPSLSAEAILSAMEGGRFYASCGVTLDEIAYDGAQYRVAVHEEPGVEYTTQFIGTLKGFDAASEPVVDSEGREIPNRTRRYSSELGVVLCETSQNPAVYDVKGNELYVRAKIISSRLQPNPHAHGDKESAWTQPIIPKGD